MLVTIDKINGHVIQKVITPKGKVLGYQTKPENACGANVVQRFAHLSAARDALGFKHVATVALTAPKSSYAQNRAGYKADPGTGQKTRIGLVTKKK